MTSRVKGFITYSLAPASRALTIWDVSVSVVTITMRIESNAGLARTRTSFARRDEARQADLADRNFISASRLDEARHATELAAQQAVAVERELARIGESLGGGPDLPVDRHPTVLAAQAELPLGDLPEQVCVHFKLVEGDTEKDNRKASGKTTRAFALAEPACTEKDGALYINFAYREHAAERNLQDKLNADTIKTLAGALPGVWRTLLLGADPTHQPKDKKDFI